MASRKTPSGGGKPDKLMRDALLLELNQEVKQAGGKITKRLRVVARKLVDRAEQGDVPAIKEIFDRVDGRVPLPQHVSNPEGGPVNVLAQLLRTIDGTSRGLPDPAKVPLPPEERACQTTVIEAKPEPVTVEQPKSERLVMPPRRTSLLPDLDKVPSRSN